MRIYKEISLKDFEFWSGAAYVRNFLTDEDMDTLEQAVEELATEDGYSETDINDLFWFESNWVAYCLGYSSWEELEKERKDNETD